MGGAQSRQRPKGLESARRVRRALEDLGVELRDFATPGMVVQLGVPPVRIDVITEISGIPTFDDAWGERVEHEIAGRPIPFLGRDTLVANKRATGRLKDLADVEALGEEP